MLHVKLATIPTGFFFSLQLQTDWIKKAIYERKIKNPDGSRNIFAPKIGVKRMQEDFFAFHLENGVALQLISETFHEHEKCSLRKIPFFNELSPAIILPKNSSYYEIFKIG